MVDWGQIDCLLICHYCTIKVINRPCLIISALQCHPQIAEEHGTIGMIDWDQIDSLLICHDRSIQVVY
jgi:hypothetical protein